MPDATIASRASADWNTALARTSVRPCRRSSKVSVSSETCPGAPSNSKVRTMPSTDGVLWKTPRNPYPVPELRAQYWSEPADELSHGILLNRAALPKPKAAGAYRGGARHCKRDAVVGLLGLAIRPRSRRTAGG